MANLLRPPRAANDSRHVLLRYAIRGSYVALSLAGGAPATDGLDIAGGKPRLVVRSSALTEDIPENVDRMSLLLLRRREFQIVGAVVRSNSVQMIDRHPVRNRPEKVTPHQAVRQAVHVTSVDRDAHLSVPVAELSIDRLRAAKHATTVVDRQLAGANCAVHNLFHISRCDHVQSLADAGVRLG